MSYQDDNRDGPPPLPPEREAYDDRYADDRDRYTAARPPQQSGGCSKGCLYGAAGCGCVTVLLAIGLGILGWKAFDFVQKSVSTDPAIVKATAQEMADFQPPAGLQPKLKMDLYIAKVAVYASDDGSSLLTLTQIDKSVVGQDKRKQDEFERNLKKGIAENHGGDKHDLEIIKSEQRDMKVRGETSKITFAEAKDPTNGKLFRLIKGGFQGKRGAVEFQLQIPEEKYKEEDAVKFLEGIK